MIKYGLISETDGLTLERTIDLIIKGFPGEFVINTLEIGIFDGQTSRGIRDYIQSKYYWVDYTKSGHKFGGGTPYKCNHTAIDNEKDKLIKLPFPECKFIRGNSNEVYNQIPDNSQHLIFVDGCHCFSHVVSDFFCYAPKVKVGGYFAFHDTGKHIKEFKDFQHGDKDNPDAFISVRKALQKIGLFGFGEYEWAGGGFNEKRKFFPGWELIFDESDSADEAGGVTIFKRLYQ